MIAAGLRLIADGLEKPDVASPPEPKSRGRSKAGETPEPKPVEAPEPEPEPAEDLATEATAPPITLEDIRPLGAKLLRLDRTRFLDILDMVGAKNMSSIPVDRLGEAFAQLTQALAEAEDA